MNEFSDNSIYAKLIRSAWRIGVVLKILSIITIGWLKGIFKSWGVMKSIENGRKLIGIKSDVVFMFENKHPYSRKTYSGKKRSDRK